MSDYLRETRSPPHELRKSILGGEEDQLNHIFRAAAQRGEIDKRKLTPRTIRLVPDLVRHELLMTLKAVPDSVIVELIDDILLPLVHR